LVVADAPSYREDRSGVLLDGPVGDCFGAALAEAGLTRDEVYITSVIKCRPPLGRAPFPDEIEACEGWLFREISLVQPNIVVTLGGLALRLVTGRQERLANVHGQLVHTQLQGRDVVVWPLVHPAVAVQVASVATELREDARRLGELIRGASAGERASKQTLRAAESASAAEKSPPVDGETQLSFEVT
jgi:DNA polymerase